MENTEFDMWFKSRLKQIRQDAKDGAKVMLPPLDKVDKIALDESINYMIEIKDDLEESFEAGFRRADGLREP